MALSRKRQKELKRLKRSAEQLWDQQRQTIEHATVVLKDARRQAANYAREEVGPRVHEAYHGRVKPVVATGVAGTRYAARTTKSRVRRRRRARRCPARSAPPSRCSRRLATRACARSCGTLSRIAASAISGEEVAGPGRYILIGLGVVAVAGIAYAAWQTLRVDDDLWIEDLGEADDSVPPRKRTSSSSQMLCRCATSGQSNGSRSPSPTRLM